MKLLLDHNLSPRLSRSLQALVEEHTIVALRDRFDQAANDVDWIGSLDREGGWGVLTKDLRIRTRPHERAAMDRACIVFFFLDGAWRRFDVLETAARLIRLMPKIISQTEIAERGRFSLPINAGSKLRLHRE